MQILIRKDRHNKPAYQTIILKVIVTLLFIFFIHNHLSAQRPASRESALKAVFLFNFTQFVEWSPNAFSSNEDPFVIGILGDDPFKNDIDEAVTGEKVQGHSIIIKRYADVKDVNYCHLLYISFKDPKHVKKILDSLPNQNLLSVSDAYNFARIGGMIRFYTIDNKIKLQINNEAAKSANLTISSKLLRLADIVN